jgi:hypothetical protein
MGGAEEAGVAVAAAACKEAPRSPPAQGRCLLLLLPLWSCVCVGASPSYIAGSGDELHSCPWAQGNVGLWWSGPSFQAQPRSSLLISSNGTPARREPVPIPALQYLFSAKRLQ